ncbi:MAG: hypothetical protein EP318_13560 [Rhodobacteraceae bacterium]|nr:MAG: hypothetical protein EP318_13560 [Paracoccaceae bacterium]
MMAARRQFLMLGGGVFATLGFPQLLPAAPVETVEMKGTARGESVWFAPMGLAIAAGTTVRFVNHDPGNSHTATAYHPALFDRARRIPAAARPWDSDFLLPDESFSVTFEAPGVHDFYCLPHEAAGMVGRIVVGQPGDPGWEGAAPDGDDLDPEVRAAFPPVEAILARGRILRGDMP